MNDAVPAARPAVTLRRWQAEAIPAAQEDIMQRGNGVTVATTGAGKSVFLAELIAWFIDAGLMTKGARVVVTTPSVKLVEQLAATIEARIGAEHVGRYYTRGKEADPLVVVCCNASARTLAADLADRAAPVALWLADEAHKTATDQITDGADDAPVDVFRADRRHGLTATPFLSDDRKRIPLFSRVTYRYAPAEALREGVIVPWRFVGWPEHRPPEEVDTACVEMIHALGPDRGPGVVNARNIEDAEAYAARLTSAGIRAEPIHSRMGRVEQAAAVARLRTGELDALVHVAMLVEGVDYPWLRWGCFRRLVGSRVRFIQELGRYLRSSPGKTEAVILDPHDLAGTFGVTYEEALGWSAPEQKPDPYPTEDLADEPREGEPPPARIQRVKTARRSALARYVRMLHLALIAEGICPEPTKIQAVGWRDEPASEKQIGALAKMVRVSARLGPHHREALGNIATTPKAITKGLASDLFDLLQGVRRLPGGEVWKPSPPVPVPPPTAWQPVADSRVWVAGVMKSGWSAVGIVADDAILFAQARPSRPGDSWASLTRAAARLATEKHGATILVSSDPDTVAAYPGAYLCQGKDNIAARAAYKAIRIQGHGA